MMKRLIYILAILFVFVSCRSKDNALVGAYGHPSQITPEIQKLFIQAMKGDMRFTPKKVRMQIVAGTNYEFLCMDTDKNPHTVVVFNPLPGRGGPRVVSIDGRPVSDGTFRFIVYYENETAKEHLSSLARERGDEIYHQYVNYRAVAIKVSSCATKDEARAFYSGVEGVHRVVEEGMMELQ